MRTNAKDELLEKVNVKDIKCAKIRLVTGSVEMSVILKVGGDVGKFLEKLDFKYDDGFGGQELFGTVWLNDNESWLERGEYDGSEWWVLKQLPKIPKNLI